MQENTNQFTKAPADDNAGGESKALSISVRGWITVIVVFTVCGMEVFRIGISEPLYSMSLIIVGFYFGQKAKSPVNNQIESK